MYTIKVNMPMDVNGKTKYILFVKDLRWETVESAIKKFYHPERSNDVEINDIEILEYPKNY